MAHLSINFGDITKQNVDAIVNAANNTLLGGGGVDGAIHRAAGIDLKEACRRLKGCKTGQAKITEGFLLPAKYVIHTVGPIWHGGGHDEARELSSCYRESLKLAAKYGVEKIAFPNISTGAYGFPIDFAARIAVKTVRDELTFSPTTIEKVIFCVFNQSNMRIYQDLLNTSVEFE